METTQFELFRVGEPIRLDRDLWPTVELVAPIWKRAADPPELFGVVVMLSRPDDGS